MRKKTVTDARGASKGPTHHLTRRLLWEWPGHSPPPAAASSRWTYVLCFRCRPHVPGKSLTRGFSLTGRVLCNQRHIAAIHVHQQPPHTHALGHQVREEQLRERHTQIHHVLPVFHPQRTAASLLSSNYAGQGLRLFEQTAAVGGLANGSEYTAVGWTMQHGGGKEMPRSQLACLVRTVAKGHPTVVSGACRERQLMERQAEPGTPSRALARPLTRTLPDGSAEYVNCSSTAAQPRWELASQRASCQFCAPVLFCGSTVAGAARTSLSRQRRPRSAGRGPEQASSGERTGARTPRWPPPSPRPRFEPPSATAHPDPPRPSAVCGKAKTSTIS